MLKNINLQLFGDEPDDTQRASSGEGEGDQQGTNTEGNTGNTEGNGTGDGNTEGNSSLPKTQEELDRIIQDRLARDRKKMGQQAQQSQQQTQQQSQQTTETQAQNGNDNLDNLLMRAQLKAYKDGKFNPKAVEDAVVLAVHEARAKGEVTEESIQTALDSVLQRNPEWAKATESKGGTGFKVGADGTEGRSSVENDVLLPKKSWNRHNN